MKLPPRIIIIIIIHEFHRDASIETKLQGRYKFQPIFTILLRLERVLKFEQNRYWNYGILFGTRYRGDEQKEYEKHESIYVN